MDINSWLPFSIGATILLGISVAFNKSPSAKGHSRFGMMFYSSSTLFVLSCIFFYSYISLTTLPMIGLAAIWGVSFTVLTLLQMYALTHVDTGALYPITTTSALLLTIIIGLGFFKDSVSIFQVVGMLIAVATIFLFLRKKTKHEFARLLAWLGVSIIALSTFNKILQKIIATSFDIHVFQMYQYFFSVIFALACLLWFHRKELKVEFQKRANIQTGILFGVFAFFGSYLLLIALKTGPISLVNSIHSFYVLPTALTAALLFKEKIDRKTWLLIAGTLIAILLIKLG